MSFDGVAFGERIVSVVRTYLEREIQPLRHRLAVLEARGVAPTVTGALIDQGGILNLALSDGTLKTLGRVIGEPGPPGTPGADGIPFDAFAITLGEDDRTLTIAASAGDKEVSWEIPLPYPVDRGVWVAEKGYARGDAVSWGGSLFIAQKDNPEGRPDAGGDGWRLAVKRGQNGKDVKP